MKYRQEKSRTGIPVFEIPVYRYFRYRYTGTQNTGHGSTAKVLTGPGGAGSQPGILLSGHLDSDHLDVKDLKNLRVEGDQLVCPGQVGSGLAT